MAIRKEDLMEALKKAEGIKNSLIGKKKNEAVDILTKQAGIKEEIAKKIASVIENIDLSKVDIRKIDLSKFDIRDDVKKVFKK